MCIFMTVRYNSTDSIARGAREYFQVKRTLRFPSSRFSALPLSLSSFNNTFKLDPLTMLHPISSTLTLLDPFTVMATLTQKNIVLLDAVFKNMAIGEVSLHTLLEPCFPSPCS